MNTVDIEMMRLVALEKEIQRENEFQQLSQKETDQVGGGIARCPPIANW